MAQATLVGYPDSGLPSVHDLVKDFLARSRPPSVEETSSNSNGSGLRRRRSARLQGRAADDASKLIAMSTALPPLGGKVICLARNPLDVAAEMFRRKRSADPKGVVWAEFVKDFTGDGRAPVAEGLWLDHVLAWESEESARPGTVLMLNLEEVLEDRAGALRRIAAFLGVPASDDALAAAAHAHIAGGEAPEPNIYKAHFTESQRLRFDLLFGVEAQRRGLRLGCADTPWPAPVRGAPKLVLGFFSVSSPLDAGVGLIFFLVIAYAFYEIARLRGLL